MIAFVYFGMLPIDSSSQEAKLLINYCKHVLDALQIKNGPGHAEIILTASGPCLVEMNCRGRFLQMTLCSHVSFTPYLTCKNCHHFHIR